jgi:hypothetical protein
MRSPVTEERLREFMKAVGAHAREDGRVYLTGGAIAVLILKIIPENDRILRALPELKEKLQINVELASPADFVPELPDGRIEAPSPRAMDWSPFIITISTHKRFQSSNADIART